MTGALFSLEGEVVAVTGSSGLLGSRFVRAILDAGGRVAMLDVAEPAQAVPAGDVVHVPCDVTDDEAVRDALEVVRDRLGTPTGLVNCAAIDAPPHTAGDVNGPFETFPSEQFDAVLDVNLQGVVRTCQVFGGAMAEVGRGSIVNIASTYGIVGPDQRLYEHLRDRGDPVLQAGGLHRVQGGDHRADPLPRVLLGAARACGSTPCRRAGSRPGRTRSSSVGTRRGRRWAGWPRRPSTTARSCSCCRGRRRT
jgi:NAD(P)-dependent dehydrogenase (short-subunit alcohol dehydrogenase family)